MSNELQKAAALAHLAANLLTGATDLDKQAEELEKQKQIEYREQIERENRKKSEAETSEKK